MDLEDGVKKGVITWEFIDAELHRQLGEENISLNQSLKRARDKIDPAGLQGRGKGEAMAVAFRTFAIAEMVVETLRAFEKHYSEIMSGNYHLELLYDSAAGALASACKKLGSDFVYASGETLTLELMGRKVITDLVMPSDPNWPESPSLRD